MKKFSKKTYKRIRIFTDIIGALFFCFLIYKLYKNNILDRI